jgi:hypothetical protein
MMTVRKVSKFVILKNVPCKTPMKATGVIDLGKTAGIVLVYRLLQAEMAVECDTKGF